MYYLIELADSSLHKIKSSKTPVRADYIKVLKIPNNLENEESGSLKITNVDIDPEFPELGTEDIVELDAAGQTAVNAANAQAEIDEKWSDMRRERDRLLAATDYLLVSDYPTAASQALKDYRQELRDLPSNIGDIDSFTYPVKP